MIGLHVSTITDRKNAEVICVQGHGVGIYVRLRGEPHAAVRGAVDLHRGALEYSHLVDFEPSKIEAGRKVFVGGADRAAWRVG